MRLSKIIGVRASALCRFEIIRAILGAFDALDSEYVEHIVKSATGDGWKMQRLSALHQYEAAVVDANEDLARELRDNGPYLVVDASRGTVRAQTDGVTCLFLDTKTASRVSVSFPDGPTKLDGRWIALTWMADDSDFCRQRIGSGNRGAGESGGKVLRFDDVVDAVCFLSLVGVSDEDITDRAAERGIKLNIDMVWDHIKAWRGRAAVLGHGLLQAAWEDRTKEGLPEWAESAIRSMSGHWDAVLSAERSFYVGAYDENATSAASEEPIEEWERELSE